MVFNAIHGADPKDNGSVTTPFHFNPSIKLASVRIGADANAPKEFVDKLRELGAVLTPIAPRPQLQGGGGGGLSVESSAAFDEYVQRKAKELGIDVATIPEPQRGGGGGGGVRGAGAPAGGGGGGGGRGGDPGNPVGMAALTRWTGGRFPRAFDFVQGQRRRYELITQMAELLKDFDMYVPANGNFDVGLHAPTGHPCAVCVQV